MRGCMPPLNTTNPIVPEQTRYDDTSSRHVPHGLHISKHKHTLLRRTMYVGPFRSHFRQSFATHTPSGLSTNSLALPGHIKLDKSERFFVFGRTLQSSTNANLHGYIFARFFSAHKLESRYTAITRNTAFVLLFYVHRLKFSVDIRSMLMAAP